jgi:hypothetical protein
MCVPARALARIGAKPHPEHVEDDAIDARNCASGAALTTGTSQRSASQLGRLPSPPMRLTAHARRGASRSPPASERGEDPPFAPVGRDAVIGRPAFLRSCLMPTAMSDDHARPIEATWRLVAGCLCGHSFAGVEDPYPWCGAEPAGPARRRDDRSLVALTGRDGM